MQGEGYDYAKKLSIKSDLYIMQFHCAMFAIQFFSVAHSEAGNSRVYVDLNQYRIASSAREIFRVRIKN